MDTAPFVIDPKFQAYLPDDSKVTDEVLEASLVEAGRAIDKLQVWKQKNTLLDGHRRWKFIQKHNLKYDIEYVDAADEAEVFHKMRNIQRGRRNLSDTTMAKLIADELEYQSRLAIQNNVENPASAAVQTVAEATGKATRTIYRAQAFIRALRKLPEGIRTRIESNELPITMKAMAELAKYEPGEQVKIVALVDSGEYKSLSEALFGEEYRESAKDNDEKWLEKAESGDEDDSDDDLEDSDEELLGEPETPKSNPSTDTASADKPLKKPSLPRKPTKTLIEEANSQLGKLKRAVDQLSQIDNRTYRQIAFRLNECGTFLDKMLLEA